MDGMQHRYKFGSTIIKASIAPQWHNPQNKKCHWTQKKKTFLGVMAFENYAIWELCHLVIMPLGVMRRHAGIIL